MSNEFRMTRRVQFAETDLAGVLHFANYFRFMEEIEHAFWRSVNLSVVCRDGEQEVSWPRVSANCEYFAPARFEDELELVLIVGKVTEKSVTYDIDFRCGGKRLAKGSTAAACCTVADGRFQSVRIPEYLRRVLVEAGSVQGKGS